MTPVGARSTSLLRGGVKLVARAGDVLRDRRPGVVVLAYHRVGAGTDSQVDLPAEDFRRHVEWLAASGLVVTLSEALELLVSPDPPRQDRIVVTFDDGTPDLVDHATPILAEHLVPATLYVATGHVEAGESFWGDGSVMTWSALAEMRDSAVWDLASHGHGHRLYDRLGATDAAEDLDRAADLLGERLGLEVRDFAYPKALVPRDPEVLEAVRERTRSAALAGTRANPYAGTDLHLLARSPVQRADGLRYFEAKARGGMALEGALRGLVGRRRYAGAER